MAAPHDDDLDWLAAVGGHPRPGTDPRTLLEATLLRAAARAYPPPPVPLDSGRDDIAALLERARREGVLRSGRRWCAGCAERWQRWRAAPWRSGGIGLAVAALLAVLVFGVLPPIDNGRDAPVLRGAAADGVWLLRRDAPQAERDRIADELAAAGWAVQRYERLGRYGLDADRPAAAAPGAAAPGAALLQRLGVQPGTDGVLRVEVEKAAP